MRVDTLTHPTRFARNSIHSLPPYQKHFSFPCLGYCLSAERYNCNTTQNTHSPCGFPNTAAERTSDRVMTIKVEHPLSASHPPPSARSSMNGAYCPGSHSNVYVKNVPQEVDEATLQAIFQPFGDVQCCRVQRNPKNVTGLTFGFVKYRTVDQAQLAIKGMNGAMVGSSVLEVKLADQDPTEKAMTGKTPSDNLYVRNLPNTWVLDDLRALFMPYGVVAECRILHNGEGQRGGGALVRMATVEEASHAINGLNGQRPHDASDILLVRYADSAEERGKRKSKKTGTSPGTNRYSPYAVGGKTQAVPANHPPPQLPQTCPVGYPTSLAPYSAWTSPGVVSDPAAPVSSAFTGSVPAGYSGQGAVYDQCAYPSYPVAQPSGAPMPCSIYVKNIPQDADKLFLYEKFAPFGAVLSVKTLTDEAGLCKGVGFVNYADNCSAMRAVQALHGTKLGERNLHVSLQTHRGRVGGSSL